ncbi:MAG TPA: lipoyl synthase, partial [Chromatiaceae bacterium]|nr:lipoyl synthase [Chromatiaceae bacterium]
MADDYLPPSRKDSRHHQRGKDKVSRIPVKVEPIPGDLPRKPAWIRAK